MTCQKYTVSPDGEKWIEAKVQSFRADNLRDPDRDERFAIKQSWRIHQADTQQRKQTRRQHKKICASETFQWQPAVAPRR